MSCLRLLIGQIRLMNPYVGCQDDLLRLLVLSNKADELSTSHGAWIPVSLKYLNWSC